MKNTSFFKALLFLVGTLHAGTDLSVTGNLRVWGKSHLTDTLTVDSLAGTGTRMVVASSTGKVTTQTIPVGGSLANPTGTIGLTAVNGSLTSGMRSDGAPALSQSIVPTWTGKHTFNDTLVGLLGIRAGNTAASNVNLYRLGANMWKTDDSLSIAGGLTVGTLAGSGTRMVVADASGITSTQTIPSTSFANPSATIGLSAVNGSASTAMRSDGAPALSQAIVPTWSGKHTFNDTVAAEKGIRAGTVAASNVNLYRSAANMWTTDDSLTVAGNLIGLQLAGSGTRMVVADPNGVTSTQAIPSGSTLANPTATIGLSAVNGSATSGMRSDGAPALSQAIVPTWSGKHTFNDTVAAELGIRAGTTAASNVNLYRSAANMWKTDDSVTIAGNLVGLQLAGTGTRMVVADANGVTSTQSIPAGASLANPTGTIGLTAVNGVLTSGMRSDGAPALSQAIVPTWSGKHTFNDTVAAELGIRAGTTAASNVNLYRSAANMWKTDDSVTIAGNLVGLQLAGSGTRMVVADPNGVTSTQAIPSGSTLANPTATIGLTAVNGSATSGMRSDGAPALSQAIVPTWSGKHTFNDTVAAELGIRAGTTAASNVILYRSAADMWNTPDSLTTAKVITPFLNWTVNGGGDPTTYAAGIDNATNPSYTWMICDTTKPLLARALFSIKYHGGRAATFKSVNFSISDSNATGAIASTITNLDNSGTSATSKLKIATGSAAGDAFTEWAAHGSDWSAGASGAVAHKWALSPTNFVDTSTAAIIVDTNLIMTHRATREYIGSGSVASNRITFDAKTADFFTATLAANDTLAFTNGVAGAHVTVRIIEDATGGRNLLFNSAFHYPGGTAPVITTTANAVNYLSFIYNESNSKWDFVGNAFDVR